MSTTRTSSLLATLVATLIVTACAGTAKRDAALEGADSTVGYTVQRGDRLGDIARELTGDMSNWRVIAESNGIDDPRTLREGAVLRIPVALIPGAAESIAERASATGSVAKRIPVTLSAVEVKRDFELSPLGTAPAVTEPAPSGPPRRVKVVGSYFPKGIYAQPAVYSKLLMRVAPGTLFELEREVEDWYGIVTDEGIGYLRDADGLVLDTPAESG